MKLNIEKMKESVRLNELYEGNEVIHDKLKTLNTRLLALPEDYVFTTRENDFLCLINNLIDSEVVVADIWEKMLTRALIECKFAFDDQVDTENRIKKELKKANDILDNYLKSQPVFDRSKRPEFKLQETFSKQLTVATVLTFMVLLVKLIYSIKFNSFTLGNETMNEKTIISYIFLTIAVLFLIGLTIAYKLVELHCGEPSKELEFTAILLTVSAPLMFSIKWLYLIAAFTLVLYFIKEKRVKKTLKGVNSYSVAEKLESINIYATTRPELFYSDIATEFWIHLNNTVDLIHQKDKIDNTKEIESVQSSINLMFDKVQAYEDARNMIESFGTDSIK